MGFGSNKGFTPGDELTVREADSDPSVSNVKTIVVSNGTLTDNGSGQVTLATGGGGGAGDVSGPGASTDDALARWNGVDGDTLQDSTVTLSDAGALTNGGNILPSADNTHDLGSPAARWANVYTGDLHLANDRGDWTVIEESDFLSLRNNKTGKRFKIMMEEITEDDE